MRRSFRSVVHVRANERTAALVALYTLHSGAIARLATMDAFRMIEAPSEQRKRLSHREKHAFHVAVEQRVVVLLGNAVQGSELRAAGIGEHDIELALLALDLGEQPIEIAEVRHVSSYAGDISSDFLYRPSQLRLTAPRDEDVGAFVHELLRRRQANTAVATGHECDLSIELTHVWLLGEERRAPGPSATVRPLLPP